MALHSKRELYELLSLRRIRLYIFTDYLCSAITCGFFCLFSLVSIVHDRLNIVSREESSDAVADAFEPAIVVLLDYVDDGPFHEGQLVLLVLGVVVDGHNFL